MNNLTDTPPDDIELPDDSEGDKDFAPDFVVRKGEVQTLNTRLYQFDSFLIEKGGRLVIQERSQRWCIIEISGDCAIHGEVVARQFREGPRAVTDSTLAGQKLDHLYENSVSGGFGGRGGISNVNGAGRQGAGGEGADSSQTFGGGGGSGAGGRLMGSIRQVFDGNSAATWRGAPPANYGNGPGGDGDTRGAYCNGGLICFVVSGSFSGDGGNIDLRGEDGARGDDGAPASGSGYDWRRVGGGGGGGGAPGGEGGHLTVLCDRNDVGAYPTVLVAGGRGGAGGSGGRGGSNIGSDGTSGADGTAGLEEWP
jgi:hypothetical protein